MKNLRVFVIGFMLFSGLTACSIEDVKPKSEVELASELTETDAEQKEIVGLSSHEFVFKETYREDENGNKECMGTEVIRLYLDSSRYYPIIFPSDVEYVTDNSKYIYAKDGSVSISVVSNVDIDNFSEFAFVDNSTSLLKNMIVTDPESNTKKREAAIYVAGNKAVIMRTYNNKVVYDTVLNGMLVNQQAVEKDVEFSVDKAELSIPGYSHNGYEISVTAGLGEDIQKIYTFDEGTLTISKELRRYDTAMDELAVKIALVSDTEDADVYYNDGTSCYFEVGDYFAGAYSVNFNTTLTCFGSGDEAKYNAIMFLQSQEGGE